MGNIGLSFHLMGGDTAIGIVADLIDALHTPEIGRVYHVGAAGPNGRYEHKVQDRRHQRPIHWGRWATVQDAADSPEEAEELRQSMEVALFHVAEGAGTAHMAIAQLDALMALRDRLRKYPPPLPNQRYVRTYRLYRGWRVKVDGGIA